MKFPDISGHWAEADIAMATELGLFGGFPDGLFHPDLPLTRAQGAALLMRQVRMGLKLANWEFESLYNKIFPFCGKVGRADGGLGTGVLVGPQSILTCHHVVAGAENELYAEWPEESWAETLGAKPKLIVELVDAKKDLALVVPSYAEAKAWAYAAEKPPSPGDYVAAFGWPLGQAATFTVGHVTSSDKLLQYYAELQQLTPTDAAINPGNSGGGLFDISGYLVGINSVKVTQPGVDNMGYAISLKDIREFLTKAGVL